MNDIEIAPSRSGLSFKMGPNVFSGNSYGGEGPSKFLKKAEIRRVKGRAP